MVVSRDYRPDEERNYGLSQAFYIMNGLAADLFFSAPLVLRQYVTNFAYQDMGCSGCNEYVGYFCRNVWYGNG